MFIIGLVILLFFIPYAWLVWSSINMKAGKIGKPHWGISLATFMVFVIVSVVLNFSISEEYQLSFFQNGVETTIAIIISGALLLVVLLVNVIVSRLFKGAPTSVHNPKLVWILAVVLCGSMLFFTAWVYPVGAKISYIQIIEDASAAAEQQHENEEFTVVFMNSEKDCFRLSGSNCTNVTYKNVFYIKNNLDVKKQVQVSIRALDSQKKERKTIESDVMTLEAGEMKLVETNETPDQASVWKLYSFESEYRIRSYEAMYRYDDVE